MKRVATVAAVVAIGMGATTMANAGSTVTIKPGSYRVTSQVWIDGKEILQGLHAARDQILANARARMSAEERAQFDREMAAQNDELDCVTPEESEVDPHIILQKTIESMRERPWQCAFTNTKADAQQVSLNYDCKTPAGAVTKGHAVFTRSQDSFRSEVVGRGHAIDGRTGVPLSPQQFDAKGITTTTWVSAQCDVESPNDDLDSESNDDVELSSP